MSKLLKKIFGDKKLWRAMERRGKALPDDYQTVYDEIKIYLLKFSSGNGMDVIGILNGVLDLFETGAADGQHVLAVTGDDIAEFCDELLRSAKTWTDVWREDLNRNVHRKLGRKE